MKVSRILNARKPNTGKVAALRVQAQRLGSIRSEVWHRFGSVQGVKCSDRQIRDQWLKDQRDFPVSANAWKETLRDAKGDITACMEAAKVKARRCVWRHTQDQTEQKRLFTALKGNDWVHDPYLRRVMRQNWKRGHNHTHNQIIANDQMSAFEYKIWSSATHPLQIEHIQPKSRGGSNRVSNLTLACAPCNQNKGHQPVEAFLADDPQRLQRIQTQAQAPLKDAAAVNATRWALCQRLQATGLPVTTGSGGLTRYNRQRLGMPKTHALDAACLGSVTTVTDWNVPTLTLRATGRGRYQRTRLNRFGFPRGYLMRTKQVKGFQTGDLIQAQVPSGKKAGTYQGRVAIRATGRFNIQTAQGVVQGISHRYCRLLQRADGYGYTFKPKPIPEDARRAA